MTALMMSARLYGQMELHLHYLLETAKALVDHGANIDLRFNDGATAFMIAAATGNTQIVRYLLSLGTNIYLKNQNGETAEMLALRKNRLNIIEIIKEAEQGEYYKNLKKKIVAEEKHIQQIAEEERKIKEARLAEEKKLEEDERLIVEAEKKEQEQLEQSLRTEKNKKIKEELQQRIDEKRAHRIAAEQARKAVVEARSLRLKEEKVAQQEQERQALIRQVDTVVKSVKDGSCTKAQQEDIKAIFARRAILVPDTIKHRCAQIQKLFGKYDAIIQIDHIVNMHPQFIKEPNKDQYKIVYSGGHFKENIDQLLRYEIVEKSAMRLDASGVGEYTFINRFDHTSFIKTVFPQNFSLDSLMELLLHSTIEKEESDVVTIKKLFDSDVVIVTAIYKNIRTRNVLKKDLFTKQLTLVSCYPLLADASLKTNKEEL